MKMVYDEINKKWVEFTYEYRNAIVGISHNIIELGYITDPYKYPLVEFNHSMYYCALDEALFKDLFEFSEDTGIYKLKIELRNKDRMHGLGKFPYDFPKVYESIHVSDIFKNKQNVLNNKEYNFAKYLKNYTFGFEFETCCGYIPQDECFRNGLIPLRDGSISGLEYTSVVLSGNKGLNLLHQQLDSLKNHCAFNRDCSLHIHIGGYPVTVRHLWFLYNVLLHFESKIKRFIPRWSFETRRYKSSRKDYCKPLWQNVRNFNDLYFMIAETNFFGDLTQCHINDPNREHKWQVGSRYHWANLVNMMCYPNPKTIEFRFLRPSFDETKIIYWLTLLVSILEYSKSLVENEKIANENIAEYLDKNFTLIKMINRQFGKADANKVKLFLKGLRSAVLEQNKRYDYIGELVEFENFNNLTV